MRVSSIPHKNEALYNLVLVISLLIVGYGGGAIIITVFPSEYWMTAGVIYGISIGPIILFTILFLFNRLLLEKKKKRNS